MTTTENDRLRELYRELNQDHDHRREALLQQLPTTVTTATHRIGSETPLQRRVTRRWWLGSGVAAAAAMLIVGISVLKPRDAWAEVVKAVRSQNWIHFVRSDFDGTFSEIWESPSAEISASKSAAEIRLVDKSTALMQVFYPDQKKVVRLELKDQEQAESMQLFMGVLLGDSERLRHLEVTDRQQRSVTENGQTWEEMRLTVQPIGGMRMIWIAKIDPNTHLPLTFRVELPDAAEPQKSLPEGKFDYPTEGPTTLAALGVPADADFEDRVPKESLKNILAEMKAQRRELGAYYLRVVEGLNGRTTFEAWKDGLKWRQDHQAPDICDGNESWSKHMGHWQRIKKIPAASAGEFCRLNSQWYYLENLTYPFLSATPEFDLVVRSDRTDGPSGCILVERVATPGANPNLVHRYTPRREQYWLDLNRNFALVKRVLTDVEAPEAECHAKGITKHTETTFGDFQKSLGGVWYPTTVKTTGTIWVKQVSPMIVEPLDQHWKLTVEFKDSLPIEVFDINAARKRSP